MRRSIPWFAAAALLATLVACDGEDTLSPQERMIAVGGYAYEGRYLHPVTAEWDTIRGSLLVSVVTPDSIFGEWDLPGFRRDPATGHWNENAYALQAVSNNGRVVVNSRLRRFGSPSQLICSLGYRETPANQDAIITSGTCDVVFEAQ